MPGSVMWSFERQEDGGYKAKYPILIEDTDLREKLESLLEALDDNDYVQEVYSNARL